MVGGGRPNLAALPRAGSLRSCQRAQVLKPRQSSLSLFSPFAADDARIGESACCGTCAADGGISSLDASSSDPPEQFSDPPVHIGGEACGGRQNLHSGETSSTILVGGGTCGSSSKFFPETDFIGDVSCSCTEFRVPVLGATGTRGDSLKEFSEDRAFPSIIIIFLPVPLMMHERSQQEIWTFPAPPLADAQESPSTRLQIGCSSRRTRVVRTLGQPCANCTLFSKRNTVRS